MHRSGKAGRRTDTPIQAAVAAVWAWTMGSLRTQQAMDASDAAPLERVQAVLLTALAPVAQKRIMRRSWRKRWLRAVDDRLQDLLALDGVVNLLRWLRGESLKNNGAADLQNRFNLHLPVPTRRPGQRLLGRSL